MFKSKIIIFSALLSLYCSNTFALGIKPKDCNFPQHFKIYGPANTHIMNLETGKLSDLTIIKTSDTSFDVEDKTQCKNDGFHSVILKAGIDNTHYSEITFIDNRRILIIASFEANQFHLKEIKNLNKFDFQLTYVAP